MKLALILSALLFAVARATPVPEADAPVDARDLVARAGPYRIIGSGVRCRDGPGTTFNSLRTLKEGELVNIGCQTTGEKINGNPVWDYIGNCYVTDHYVNSGGQTWIPGVPRCGGGGCRRSGDNEGSDEERSLRC